MRRGLKWTLWSTSTFVISGWGYLVQAKNDVNMVMDQNERGSYQGSIEQYKR